MATESSAPARCQRVFAPALLPAAMAWLLVASCLLLAASSWEPGDALAGEVPSGTESICDDSIDNDTDLLPDCLDPDCADDAACMVCGNGVIGNDEECDDGEPPYSPGDFCSLSCHLVPCGQPISSSAAKPKTSDALFVLGAAVEQFPCDPRVCDVNDSEEISVTDALLVLKKVVGIPLQLTCPAGGSMHIVPNAAEKLPGGTQRFVVATGPAGPYTWSVNDIDGGDDTFGTIDSTGFYVAPAAVPVPSTFDVCARVTADPAVFDCSPMTINEIPTAGEDVVVFNDINMLDDTSMTNPNNVLMLHNLLGYSATGPRASGDVVLVDGGHSSICDGALCDSAFNTFTTQVATEGFTLTIDNSGDLSTIAANVKVVILWLPTEFYTAAEINGFKKFASEGGRIVFIGEHSQYYGGGFPAQNDFLTKMGAVMTNVGDFVDCPHVTLPSTSLRSHQVTAGMTNVSMACSSEILLGPNDFALYYDSSNTRVLSGVAKIDVVPQP